MSKFKHYAEQILESDSKQFISKAQKNKLDNLTVNSEAFTAGIGNLFEVAESDWISEEEGFKYRLNHQLDIPMESLDVNFYDTEKNHIKLDFKFIDNNNIDIFINNEANILVTMDKIIKGVVENSILDNYYNKQEIDEKLNAIPEMNNNVSEISSQINALKTNYFGKEFDTAQERFLNEFEYIHTSGERGSFLPFTDSKNHKILDSIEGRTRNMILKGETLQNLYGSSINEFRITNAELISLKDNKFKIQANGTYLDSFFLSKNLLKANTKYTVICDVYKNTLNQDGRFHINIDYQNKSSFIEKFEIQNFGIGRIQKVLTTKSDLNITEVALRTQLENTCTSGEIEYSIIILEGDWTNKKVPSYFKEIKNVGQEENKISILSHGKNLFNLDKFKELLKTSLVEDLEDGVIVVNRVVDLTAMVKFENKNYRFIYKREIVEGNGNSLFHVLYSNGTEKYLNGDDVFSGNNITKFEITYNNNGKTKLTDIILSDENNQNYEPYKQNKKDILIPFDGGLKGINNIRDEINGITIKIIKRIEKTIVSKESTITPYIHEELNNHPDYVGFTIGNCVTGPKYYTGNEDNIGISNVGLVCGIWATLSCKNNINLCPHENGNIYGSIKKSLLKTEDINGVKNWFNDINEFIIYYELAEPIEYDLVNQDLNLNTYNELTYISSNAIANFSAPVTIGNTISRLNKENKELIKRNELLQQDLYNTKEHFYSKDIDLEINDLDLDFRLLEVELAMNIGKTSLKNSSRAVNAYETMKKMILLNRYDREDLEYKISVYLKAGRITQEQADELIELMDQNEMKPSK